MISALELVIYRPGSSPLSRKTLAVESCSFPRRQSPYFASLLGASSEGQRKGAISYLSELYRTPRPMPLAGRTLEHFSRDPQRTSWPLPASNKALPALRRSRLADPRVEPSSRCASLPGTSLQVVCFWQSPTDRTLPNPRGAGHPPIRGVLLEGAMAVRLNLAPRAPASAAVP